MATLNGATALGLGDRDGRCAEVLGEEPSQVTLADSEAARENVDGAFIEGALADQPNGARDRCRRALPGGRPWRRFRAAAQAWPEAGLLGGRRARHEQAILESGRARRADRPAIDSGRPDRYEEASVEASVPGLEGAIAGIRVERRGCFRVAGLHGRGYSVEADRN